MKKWKPEEGQLYWFVWITINFHIYSLHWAGGSKSCQYAYKIGNCFRTRREAQHAAGEIRKILKGGRK